ncbi:hypothetical protein HG531_003423 [Fusarium graminearum]|nr:hypothetical protein HG531_003423 [Fusarium graminearum]
MLRHTDSDMIEGIAYLDVVLELLPLLTHCGPELLTQHRGTSANSAIWWNCPETLAIKVLLKLGDMFTSLLHVCLKSFAQCRHLSLKLSLHYLDIVKVVLKLDLLTLSTECFLRDILELLHCSGQLILEPRELVLELHHLAASLNSCHVGGPLGTGTVSTIQFSLSDAPAAPASISFLETSFDIIGLFQFGFEGSDGGTVYLDLILESVGLLDFSAKSCKLCVALLDLSMGGVGLLKLRLKCSDLSVALFDLTLGRLQISQLGFESSNLTLTIVNLGLGRSSGSRRIGKIRSDVVELLLQAVNLVFPVFDLRMCCTSRSSCTGQITLQAL